METLKLYDIYAYIDESGVVKELTVWDPESLESFSVATERAKVIYGREAIAKNVTNIPIRKGDKYINGLFYRQDLNSGEYTIQINPEKTIDEIITGLVEDVTNLKEKIK